MQITFRFADGKPDKRFEPVYLRNGNSFPPADVSPLRFHPVGTAGPRFPESVTMRRSNPAPICIPMRQVSRAERSVARLPDDHSRAPDAVMSKGGSCVNEARYRTFFDDDVNRPRFPSIFAVFGNIFPLHGTVFAFVSFVRTYIASGEHAWETGACDDQSRNGSKRRAFGLHGLA